MIRKGKHWQLLIGAVGFVVLLVILGYSNFFTSKKVANTQITNSAENSAKESNFSYPLTKTIAYSYTLTNTSDSRIDDVSFYTYGPLKQTPFQKLKILDANMAYETIKDQIGNHILKFQLQNIPPFATRQISIKAQIQTSNRANRYPLIDDSERYLFDTPFLNLGSPKVKKLAQKLLHQQQDQTVEETFLWTMRSIKYGGYEQKERAVTETLASKTGDCTDYMHVFTALNRNNHIPTREIGGFVVKDNKRLHADDYHNWAEYYLEDAWNLADPQNKVFKKQSGNYIAFNYYGDDEHSPLNQFRRYKVTDKRIKISMN